MKYFGVSRLVSLLVFCLAMGMICGCKKTTDYSGTIEQLTAFIEQKMEENQVTGLSIALVDDQNVVWAKGFGYADKENDVKAAAETIYKIGSVSKTITAAAIMQLYEQKKLDIDRPLADYLSEFSVQPPLRPGPTPADPITIRTMLTHHSGIPGDLLNGAFTIEFDPDYNEQLLDVLHHEYAYYSPNFIDAYSNSAISLLGEVVAKVSGQSFEKYTDRLFEEMGMQHSSFFLNKPFLKEKLARGYFKDSPVDRININIFAAGSVVSSVLDMALYIQMVLAEGQSEGRTVLRSKTIAEMLTPQNEDIPLDFDLRQGISWFLSDAELDYAGRLCHHSGAGIVFRSHLEILLDYKLGVVVLSNSGTALSVVQEAARQALKLALKEKAGIEPTDPPPPAFSPYTSRSQEKLEALAGIYVTGSGYDIIKAVPGALDWIRGKEPVLRLVPLENGRFALPDSQEFQIEFSQISGRNVMVRYGGGTQVEGMLGKVELIGEKYQPVSISAAWQNRLGQYKISNLDPEDCTRFVPEGVRNISLSIELTERDGMLVIGYTIQNELCWLVIEPLGDTLGVIRGLGRDQSGAVQIVTVDGQEQLQFWGNLYKRS